MSAKFRVILPDGRKTKPYDRASISKAFSQGKLPDGSQVDSPQGEVPIAAFVLPETTAPDPPPSVEDVLSDDDLDDSPIRPRTRRSSSKEALVIVGVVAGILIVGIVSFAAWPSGPADRDVVADKSAIEPGKDADEAQALADPIPANRVTVEGIVASLNKDWKSEGVAGRYDLYESQDMNDLLLALNVEDGELREAMVMAGADSYDAMAYLNITHTVSHLLDTPEAISNFSVWFYSTQEMVLDGRAYWHGADSSRFKVYAFKQTLTDLFPDLKVVGVYLYPKSEEQPRPYSSLKTLGFEPSVPGQNE